MAQQSEVHNPFLLMISPEVVLAAIENSERLGRLNRHLCRPLDRPAGPGTAATPDAADLPEDGLQDDLDGPH
jgi:hypothetical protein